MDRIRATYGRPATQEEKAELLALLREHLADDIDAIMQVLGITWPEFERLYASRGEVRAITADKEKVGYYWIEQRGCELHIHAIFVLPAYRGRGIGTEMIRALEREFRGKVDVIELGVRESNQAARSLYERQGFATTSALPEIGFLVMRKQITRGPTR